MKAGFQRKRSAGLGVPKLRNLLDSDVSYSSEGRGMNNRRASQRWVVPMLCWHCCQAAHSM